MSGQGRLWNRVVLTNPGLTATCEHHSNSNNRYYGEGTPRTCRVAAVGSGGVCTAPGAAFGVSETGGEGGCVRGGLTGECSCRVCAGCVQGMCCVSAGCVQGMCWVCAAQSSSLVGSRWCVYRMQGCCGRPAQRAAQAQQHTCSAAHRCTGIAQAFFDLELTMSPIMHVFRCEGFVK